MGDESIFRNESHAPQIILRARPESWQRQCAGKKLLVIREQGHVERNSGDKLFLPSGVLKTEAEDLDVKSFELFVTY